VLELDVDPFSRADVGSFSRALKSASPKGRAGYTSMTNPAERARRSERSNIKGPRRPGPRALSTWPYTAAVASASGLVRGRLRWHPVAGAQRPLRGALEDEPARGAHVVRARPRVPSAPVQLRPVRGRGRREPLSRSPAGASRSLLARRHAAAVCAWPSSTKSWGMSRGFGASINSQWTRPTESCVVVYYQQRAATPPLASAPQFTTRLASSSKAV
jgi:hypothetical protein